VVVDEAYLEYSEDFRSRTATSLIREGANVVVFRTFDKIYGLAGMPIGYVIAPRSLADALRGLPGKVIAIDQDAVSAFLAGFLRAFDRWRTLSPISKVFAPLIAAPITGSESAVPRLARESWIDPCNGKKNRIRYLIIQPTD
jgi:Aminotransferase class I and II